jgi:predicted transport protein
MDMLNYLKKGGIIMKNGFVDLPIKHIKEEDALGVHKYVSGISNFIVECPTPMTMAIQGGWGSGKTSLMNLVEENITKENKHIINIRVNTWQYSQFKMDDQLSISLIQNIIRKLNEKTTNKKGVISDKAKGLAKLLGSIAMYQVGGESASDIIKALSNSDITDLSSLIEKLKEELNEYVDGLMASQFERIVVYVDDLDRLEPKRAVELLEVLKNFFDCRHIVWVLAIDYDVIYRGVKVKYPGITDEKSKKFFDKLIQVPFQVPIQQYNVGGLVGKLTGNSYSKNVEDTIVSLITKSIGRNPREIKRLFNTFTLNTKMMDNIIDANTKVILLSILSMQVAYEGVYNFLLSQKDELDNIFDTVDELTDFINPDYNEVDEESEQYKREKDKFLDYMTVFLECIKYREDNKDLGRFTEVLLLSSTTKRGELDMDNVIFANEKLLNEYNLHDQYSNLIECLKNITETELPSNELVIKRIKTYDKLIIDNTIVGSISVQKKLFVLYFKLNKNEYEGTNIDLGNLSNVSTVGRKGVGTLRIDVDVSNDINGYRQQLALLLTDSFKTNES